ncbi:MAG TPA: polymer-forming cytoskeletal protein [Labilithrix sp.]
MWPFDRRPKNDIPTFAVENTLGAGTIVRGDVLGPGGFCVDGVIEGCLQADGPVVIGETGVVMGKVTGLAVVVLGRVRGDVESTGHLEIGPTGSVVGDISVTSFRMHKGGVFRGTSRMRGADDADVPALAAAPVKGRTLPPASGGVPPPPVAVITTPAPIPEGLVSQERLVTTLHDDDVVSDREPPHEDEKKKTG